MSLIFRGLFLFGLISTLALAESHGVDPGPAKGSEAPMPPPPPKVAKCEPTKESITQRANHDFVVETLERSIAAERKQVEQDRASITELKRKMAQGHTDQVDGVAIAAMTIPVGLLMSHYKAKNMSNRPRLPGYLLAGVGASTGISGFVGGDRKIEQAKQGIESLEAAIAEREKHLDKVEAKLKTMRNGADKK
jgi:uncharacterized coiled-coil protein SlyX